MLDNRHQTLIDKLSDYIHNEAEEQTKHFTESYQEGYISGLSKAISIITREGDR